ncbi:MAG: hypothetical protein ACRDRB_12915, partial [Pseudonocardiaceae bacterium]
MTGYEGEGMPALRDGEAFRVASRSSSWLAAGLTAVAMLTLPGCSPGLTSATAPVHPKENLGAPTPLAPLPQAAPEPLGVIGAAAPRLQWRRCAGSFQCAAATVPLDYNQPHGATITLSVI